MSEEFPSAEEADRQMKVRIEEAQKTVTEFLRYVEHSWDGFPGEEQWQGEFKDFLSQYYDYAKRLEGELLASDRDGMKAALLESLRKYEGLKSVGDLQRVWLSILRF